MCGLYGRIGARKDDLDLRATQSLHHRGPDDAGLGLDEQGPAGQTVALGHTRLAILDLSPAGHQPMGTDDGALWIVFNGEIYNYLGLRQRLEASGHRFRSHTDTEVLLHLYAVHGDGMLDHIEGMYAFALWDRNEKRLLLARDPVGVKPLFYRLGIPGQRGADLLAFASEIKALLVDPAVARTPDAGALAGYLAYLYVPPPRTAFAGILSLEPGCKLVVEADGATRIERFHGFRVTPKLALHREQDAADALEHLLLQVVGEQMLADVPVGAFLSGGIDSGLLVAMMARIKRDRGDREQVRTFTVGFGEEGKRWDEVGRAAAMAKTLGADHTVLRVPATLAEERFPFVVEQFDQPFANPTALVHDVLCEGARREVTVALAGDGGDEAFGGYPRYRAAQLLQAWSELPEGLRKVVELGAAGTARLAARLPEKAEGLPLLRQARRFLTAGGGRFAETYRGWLTYYPQAELQALLSDSARRAERSPDHTLQAIDGLGYGADRLDAASYADLYGFLPNNVLQESDRVSMRHALEVRVPLADRRVVEFGLRLASDLRMPKTVLAPGGGSRSKRVLRAVAARYLPADVVRAPKQGFGAPMGAWLAGPLQGLLQRATDPVRLQARGLVRPELVQTMHAEHLAGKRDRTWNLWALVVLEAWFEQRIDRFDLPDRRSVPVRVDTLGPPAA